MAMTEKIKIMLIKRKMTVADLAKILNCTPTNMYHKLKRDNFTEREIIKIANILDCSFKGSFILNDTQEAV